MFVKETKGMKNFMYHFPSIFTVIMNWNNLSTSNTADGGVTPTKKERENNVVQALVLWEKIIYQRWHYQKLIFSMDEYTNIKFWSHIV